MIAVDGEIREAYIDRNMVWGFISGDRKFGFSDGDFGHTSLIVSREYEPETGAEIVHTSNSVYRVYMGKKP